MDLALGFIRSARTFTSTVALAAAVFSGHAGSAGPSVTVANVPLPVTGSVSATVSGTVNANVTNAVLPVTGTVGVSSLPPVSLALPAQPFHASINLNVAGVAKAAGVSGQRLAVTTITVSNFNGTTQQLFLFNPLMDSGSCGGNVVGGANPQVTVLLEPFKTLQLQFPTPRIFEFGGLGCLAAEVTTVMAGGSVLVDVIGYAAP
jgi:hypothetical protein